ncbi:MAG: hypothetical protein WCI92_04040 [Bacteroidota bacterium]
MKTSVLIPTFAALCLLVTFAEKPRHKSAENSNVSLVSSFYFSPDKFVYEEPVLNSSVVKAQNAHTKRAENTKECFGYLKFDLADYKDNTEMLTEETAGNSFEYLKFDVSRYTDNTKPMVPDESGMPENEFANLKFDVSEYNGTAALMPYDKIELPEDEFEYLKFDVNKFIVNDETNAAETMGLPADEFSYLKFDVNKYSSQINLGAGNIGELTENE